MDSSILLHWVVLFLYIHLHFIFLDIAIYCLSLIAKRESSKKIKNKMIEIEKLFKVELNIDYATGRL